MYIHIHTYIHIIWLQIPKQLLFQASQCEFFKILFIFLTTKAYLHSIITHFLKTEEVASTERYNVKQNYHEYLQWRGVVSAG